MADDLPQFLSTKQAETWTGLRGLAKRRCTGSNSPPFIRVGARVVYDRDSLASWMRQHTFSNTSEFSAAQAMAAGDCDQNRKVAVADRETE